MDSLLVCPPPGRRFWLASKAAASRGFTLVEMLVTLAIVSILLMVGVPSMTEFLADQAAAANAEEFAEALRFARTEAMKRGGSVSMCATDDAEAASPVCSAADTWSKGWLIIDAGSGKVLRVQNALSAMNAGTPIEAAADQVDFAATGIATAGSGAYVFNPVGDSSAAGYSKRVRTVNLSVQGRVQVTKGS